MVKFLKCNVTIDTYKQKFAKALTFGQYADIIALQYKFKGMNFMNSNELLNNTFMAISMLEEIKNNEEYAEIINDVNKINTALNGYLINENGITYDWNRLFWNLYNKYMQKPEFRVIVESYQNRFDYFNVRNNKSTNLNQSLENRLLNLKKWILRYFLIRYAENRYGKMYIDQYKNVSSARNIDELNERTSQVDEELCNDLNIKRMQ